MRWDDDDAPSAPRSRIHTLIYLTRALYSLKMYIIIHKYMNDKVVWIHTERTSRPCRDKASATFLALRTFRRGLYYEKMLNSLFISSFCYLGGHKALILRLRRRLFNILTRFLRAFRPQIRAAFTGKSSPASIVRSDTGFHSANYIICHIFYLIIYYCIMRHNVRMFFFCLCTYLSLPACSIFCRHVKCGRAKSIQNVFIGDF